MQKIELDIVALSHSLTQSHSYAVVLGEKEGSRRLPIVIGGFEAQSIALALENMESKRPLTHDLTKSICDMFNVSCKEIIIDNLIEGVFHSKLVLTNDTQEFEIDSRTSDALAMALRFKCPIYTYEFILDQAGIVLELEDTDSGTKTNTRKRSKVILTDNQQDFSKFSVNELNNMLNDYLDNEDYEKAIIIRDELNKREDENS